MTETATADHTTSDMLTPDTNRSGEIATIAAADVPAVPADYDEFELAVRRQLGLEDASEGELRLFHHVCQRTGLDPFLKHIYMIGRNTEVASYEPANPAEPDGPKRKVVRWVTKYTIQVSIDGFRKRAREIASSLGVSYSQADPLWCGDDGEWREVWVDKNPPTAAKVTVFRDGQPYSFVAHYDEFVQESGKGADRGPNSMWSKMPRNQLRKCAEANAIKAAFPDQLGGLVLDLAAQPDIIDAQPTRVHSERARGVNALRERAAQAGRGGGNDQSHGAEPSSSAQSQDDSGDQAAATRRKWVDRLFDLLQAGDVDDVDDQIVVVTELADRRGNPPERPDTVSDAELRTVVEKLHAMSQKGDLGGQLNDLLNAAAAREADEQEAAAAENATADKPQ